VQATGPVLVVDDDESIREFVSVALSEEGYRVATAEDGRAALAKIRQERPALILLDLWMPGLDGRGFLEQYRQEPPPRAPVIIFAASADADALANDAEIASFLWKPVDLNDLLAQVARYVPRC
jgi:CheY-like chemotaxis protein